MSEEKKISKKTLKIILGVCVGAVVALVVGFFAYIHVADTNTLGRKITIYGLDVSKLGVEDAKQKILTTFQDKKIVFKENGADVYSLTLKDLVTAWMKMTLRRSLQNFRRRERQTARSLQNRRM